MKADPEFHVYQIPARVPEGVRTGVGHLGTRHLTTGHTSPGINKAVLHSMDFLSHLPYIVSLGFVLYSVSRPFWLCPVRSTLLQYVLDSSSTCRLTQIVLGTDSASICSYSSLYLVSHALLHSLTHASSGLVYKEDILCPCSSVVRSQTEE